MRKARKTLVRKKVPVFDPQFTVDFFEEDHTYKIEDISTPSVTTAIEDVFPFSKFVDPEILEYKGLLGSYTHQAVDYYVKGELDEDSLSEEIKPRYEAFIDFKEAYELTDMKSEIRVGSKKIWSSGTLDMFAWSDLLKSLVLIDFKTGVKTKTWGIQTGAYEFMLREIMKISPRFKIQRMAVQLKEDGSYKESFFDEKDDIDVYLACLTIYNRRHK